MAVSSAPAARPAADPHRVFLDTRFFSTLDGLRALAILFVIGHHAMPAGDPVFGFEVHFALFFAISGFLITTLLLREQARHGDISLRRFFVRRALRIYPLYYGVLALYVVLVLVVERGTAPGAAFWDNLPAFLTFTTNWFVPYTGEGRVIFYFAWSLAAQEQFYLVWPWVVRSARTRRWLPVAFLGLLLAADAAITALLSGGVVQMGDTAARIATSPSGPIVLGCLLAYAVHWAPGFRAVYAVLGRRWSLPAAFAVMAACYVARVPEVWMTLSMVAVIGAGCVRPDATWNGVLSNRGLAYLGTISYGLYLLHMLSLNVARQLPLGGDWPTYLATVAIATTAATLSFRYFETPILSLKERYAGRRTAAPEGAVPESGTLPPAARPNLAIPLPPRSA